MVCIEPMAHHVAAAHGLGKAAYRSMWHCLGEVHMHRLLKTAIGDSIQTVTHESACCMHANPNTDTLVLGATHLLLSMLRLRNSMLADTEVALV